MSNGSFWYGSNINFPGFLYKKNGGAGVKRVLSRVSCNKPKDLNNVYIPGSGVGATNISVRRSKLLLASKCCNKASLL